MCSHLMRLSNSIISAFYLFTTCIFSTSSAEKVNKINSAIRGWESCHLCMCDVWDGDSQILILWFLYVIPYLKQKTAKELLYQYHTEYRVLTATECYLPCHSVDLHEEWKEFISFWTHASLTLLACCPWGEEWSVMVGKGMKSTKDRPSDLQKCCSSTTDPH